MTDDDVYELRCVDCGGPFVDGKIFHISGGVVINSHTSIEDEILLEYESGDLCRACYSFRLLQLRTKSSRI
jgi:hypothetical protein